MTANMGSAGAPGKDSKPVDEIKVSVTFIGANKPFDTGVPPTTTVGTIKQAALDAFGLGVGPTPDGNDRITYTLFEGKTKLEDLNQSIGDVAGHAHSVHLKLVKKIIQG